MFRLDVHYEIVVDLVNKKRHPPKIRYISSPLNCTIFQPVCQELFSGLCKESDIINVSKSDKLKQLCLQINHSRPSDIGGEGLNWIVNCLIKGVSKALG